MLERKLLQMEAEVENRRWQQRRSEIALYESFRELESQRFQLQQANFWADNAHRERINLCGELEMRNQLFQGTRTKDYRELGALRDCCYQESDKARRARLDELSMRQQRNPQTVNQLMAQIRELQDKVNSLSDAIPQKSKCQRAACSKIRQILTRKTDCVHDLRVLSCKREHVNLCKDSQTYSLLFTLRLQNDDVQDFDVRWGQAWLSTNEPLTDTVLDGLYKYKLQDSVQLQTVLAMYDQETVRNN